MKNEILSTYQNGKKEGVLYPPRGWDKPEAGLFTLDELSRSNKELEHFAFIAAHDLQEPLSLAFSYVQLLNKKYAGKLDKNADEIISLILESTERMQKLIQSLLNYSQVGKGDIQFEKLDSRIVIKRAINNLKVNIEEHSAQITFDDCPLIRGDETQLTQLFQNLINNAIKFRKKDEIPRIHISIQQKNDQWLFAVKDNGIGVETEYIQSIFELFRKLHAQSEYAGSGIGLALCKRIVESHRGEIWVESEIGKGTAVYFTVPQV